MKKNGYTLVEVICAIVIVGMVFVAMASMLISSSKINKNFVIKENVVAEVENIYNIFTSDPINFTTKISELYDKVDVEENEGIKKFHIYYNSRFIDTKYKTDNYIYLEYEKTNNIYELKLDSYYDNKILDDYSSLSREIYKVSQ